jgi:EAL domain-containing protein (putative c-di-GMP-specific phosphodiesterase class I)
VLARWLHPQRGFISPALFIPIAESAGLIEPLFWRTLEAACDHHKKVGADTLLSVNLSPVQAKDPLFAQKLLQVLTRLSFPASRLEVEVTESAMIADADMARATLLSLKNQGVRIALDDFGTGYSSLVLLRDLPIDKVKIDRSFVSHVIDGDGPDGKIIDAILGMAQALKLSVTAEGIETEAAAQALREKGCQFGQGYLFSAAQAELTLDLRSDQDPQAARAVA